VNAGGNDFRARIGFLGRKRLAPPAHTNTTIPRYCRTAV